jgi:hypothetical protein
MTSTQLANKDLDEVLDRLRRRVGDTCSIAKIRKNLTDTQQADFDYLLGRIGENVAATTVARALSEVLGLTIRPGTLLRHTQGACGCERS